MFVTRRTYDFQTDVKFKNNNEKIFETIKYCEYGFYIRKEHLEQIAWLL